ncbi:pilus assembly protein TadG-related protein [Guptibacillus hwajinpoensis]|uniref:pilus assembly protein TadG-related protein n=1 Tax=Guptibacillus hwajinpoensis TaxID=208199 RepID=UPI001CFE24B3|nr:TadE/TadG family type IV pilus assembly protein [Pseudalkalibacillus hwajinpoensis]
MMKNLRALLMNEKGNVAVMLALSLTVLLGVTAMVVDVGRLYHEKRILQNAMDAAALSGAQGLVTSEVSAASIAKDLASKNSFPVSNSDLTITNKSIKVSRESTVPMTFARVFGIQEASVQAAAKAEIGLLKSAKRVTPIAIEYTAIPNETELKCENTGNHHGNCGYLDIDSNGASGLADKIINGTEIEVGTSVQTEPGQKWGPVEGAIETLISKDAGKSKCQQALTADYSCARVIVIPLIDSWDGANGKSSVKVVGLSAYWIDRLDEPKRIVGEFKDIVTSGEIGSTGPGNLYGVTLVE